MKWMKGYLAGLFTALLVCGLVVTAGAKSGKVVQELTYRDIRVSLDGEVLDLRNAIGEKVEPFMFDGTNYLPVRALAEALGLNVAWDGKEVMVVLTTPQPVLETEQETVPVAGGDIIPQTPATVKAGDTEPEVTDAEIIPGSTPVSGTPIVSSNVGILDKHRVEIKRARLVRHWNGLAIIVTYEWTNNDERATSAGISFNSEASQNGAQLAPAFPDDYNRDAHLEKVQPGASLEVETAFSLRNETDPVEVTLIDLLKKSENPVKMTFNLSEMEKPAPVESAKAETPTTSTKTESVETPKNVETPKVEEKPKVTSPAPSAVNGRTVYVTKTGKHYHYSGSCNGGNYYRSTLSEALARGLTPCDKCVLTGN